MDHIKAGYFKRKRMFDIHTKIYVAIFAINRLKHILPSESGEKVSNYTIITEEFNHFYVKIGKTVSESIPSPCSLISFALIKDRSAVNFFMQPTDTNDIKNVVKNLKIKCNVGFDSLSTKLIKHTIEEIINPLEHTINQSFVIGRGSPRKSKNCQSNSNI